MDNLAGSRSAAEYYSADGLVRSAAMLNDAPHPTAYRSSADVILSSDVCL